MWRLWYALDELLHLREIWDNIAGTGDAVSGVEVQHESEGYKGPALQTPTLCHGFKHPFWHI